MRAIHDHDCAIHRSPICDCGALLKCSRLGRIGGWDEHCAAIKAVVAQSSPLYNPVYMAKEREQDDKFYEALKANVEDKTRTSSN